VIVLGTGPAGLTAALFAARAGLSTLVLGSDGGSLLSETHDLQNFPSFTNEKGPAWLQSTKQQAAQWGASFVQAGILVDKMTSTTMTVSSGSGSGSGSGGSSSSTDNNEELSPIFSLSAANVGGKNKALSLQARSVIVATGATGRRLNLPLEQSLWGKFVHSCAVCDGSSYVNKTVVVVGGGDAAMDGALLLARYARQVILVHRRPELRASNQRNVELVRSTSNIRLEIPFEIKRFETSTNSITKGKSNSQQVVLTGVQLQHAETQVLQHAACDGVFELIGSTPNTSWLQSNDATEKSKLPQTNKDGFLLLSNSNAGTRTATTLEGVFAAGEVTDQIYRQAITAAAEGAQAAMDAERWLRAHPVPPVSAVAAAAAKTNDIPLQVVLPATSLQKELADGEAHPTPTGRQIPNEEQDSKEDELDCEMTQQECITKLVSRYPVVVFSKPWCPYCRKALEALVAEGLAEGHDNLHIVDLSLLGQKMRKVQGTLNELTGRRTVPNVFVGGTSIGGGDETIMFHREGTLRTMLVEAKAIPGEAFSNEGKNASRQTKESEDNCTDLTKEKCITQLVNHYAVVVFSKETCPYCRQALEALALEGLILGSSKLHVVNLSAMADMQQIQDQLENMTGRRTVPNIFLGGSSIGGGSETVLLQRNGDLRSMLKKIQALS